MKENILPHSVEAEKATLGGMMLDKNIAFDVIEIVSEEDFYVSAHIEIFRAICELLKENKGVDLLTVCDKLRQKGCLDIVGGRAYIASLISEVPTVINTTEYAKVVFRKSLARKLIMATNKAKELAYRDEGDIIDTLGEAEKDILSISQKGQKNNYKMITDVMMNTLNKIDEAAKSQEGITGVPTGFKKLDALLGGLQKSSYNVIAARPSMGKTAFGLNIALNAASAGKSVLFFSLEMDHEQLGMRLLASKARVDASHIQKGSLSAEEWNRINDALDSFNENDKFAIDETSGITLMEIKNKCRRFKREHGLDLVVIDYIGLMQSKEKSDNRQDEVRRLSLGLKELAKDLKCPVVVLCQLRRLNAMEKVKIPTISDLRESGAIEQDADVIMLLHRDDYYTKDESKKPGVCDVIIGKNRNGPIDTVELTWVSRYTRFSDMA